MLLLTKLWNRSLLTMFINERACHAFNAVTASAIGPPLKKYEGLSFLILSYTKCDSSS